MVEASPSSTLVVAQSHLLLQILIVSFDAPSEFRGIDEIHEARALGQCAEPILRWLGLILGPFDEKPLFGPALLELLIAMGGPDAQSGKPGREVIGRAFAPGDPLPGRRREAHREVLDLDRPGDRPARGRPALHELVPWFIVGFLVVLTIRSLGLIPAPALPPIGVTASILTTVSMAALGLGVDVRVVAAAGLRVTAVVTASLVVLGVISFGLIRFLGVA